MNFLKTELVYWLWCRWRGHYRFHTDWAVYIDPRYPDFTVRICAGCDRIFPDDVETACTALEKALDDE